MRTRRDPLPENADPLPPTSEPTTRAAPRRGRPALAEDEVAQRVARYCGRYGIDTPAAGSLPPFPSGRRETAQHREWLLVYRALKRLAARRAETAPAARLPAGQASCTVCGRPAAGPEVRLGRSLVRLDAGCSELAQRAREAGPEALGRLTTLLWPSRRPEEG